jgi:hypothetical protein
LGRRLLTKRQNSCILPQLDLHWSIHTLVDVLVAPNVTAGTVIMVDASAFASVLGAPSFRASQHAAIHMDTAPSALSATGSPNTVAAPMRSAFQSDTTALRSIIPIDWVLRRTGAAAVMNSVTW